jgi:cytochrome c551/c552
LTLAADNSAQPFNYFVPNQNQCSGCHQTEHPDGDMLPLGARLAQLASAFKDNNNQLNSLQARGWLATLPEQPVPVDWQDENQSIEARAQAYLNINCGHCHNPQGPADTSALILDGSARNPAQLGICKPPVAAGGGAGNLLYGIVPGQPESSILHYRMQSVAADEMMPELGRSLTHHEGVSLISDWIESLSGSCN